MKKKKTQRHHVVPISLQGFDWDQNIMTVTVYEHNLIHATLNIPYDKIRKFRIRTNSMTSMVSQFYVNELRKVHVAFFQKVDLLKPELRIKMRDCIRETTKRIIKEHRIELKTPVEGASLHRWLRSYHYALVLR
jgi:hypothetical protein